MNRLKTAIALTSLAALAACADGSTPTGAAPSRPTFSAGGIGMGAGNVAPTDTTSATTSTSTTTAAPDSGQGRGGFGMGSGG